MRKRAPLVLTASASADERHRLAAALEEGGFEIRLVDEAEKADAEIRDHPGVCVLVIDSGLLEMHHDGQWRSLCERNPTLATVVRCWAPKNPAVRSKERRQLRVHPDDPEGLLNAIRSLAATVG